MFQKVWLSIAISIFTVILVTACSAGNQDIRVISFTGNVSADGVTLEKPQSVTDGALIKTGPDSACEITFSGKNILHLEENTTIKLTAASKKLLEIKTGSVAAILKSLKQNNTDNDALFQVETLNAVASVRGTSFYIKASGDETYFCLCNGQLELGDVLGISNFTVTAEHHKAYLFTTSAAGISITNADMLYHTDKGLESLASKIHYKLDWTKADLKY